MKVSEFYQTEGKWLKAADLQGRKHRVTVGSIEALEFEKDGKKTKKLGLTLVGKQKGLVLNMTNAKIVSAQLGDDIELWTGKTISIYPGQTKFGQDMVDCIMVEQIIPEADPDDSIPFN